MDFFMAFLLNITFHLFSHKPKAFPKFLIKIHLCALFNAFLLPKSFCFLKTHHLSNILTFFYAIVYYLKDYLLT